MAAITPPQDLPPKGGFPSIKIDRLKPHIEFPARKIIAVTALIHVVGLMWYYRDRKMKRRHKIEHRSAEFALQPLIQAERDRTVLKQMRINRDEERRLMKDNPRWTVGGYYGENIFLSLPEDTYVEPHWNEYAAHAHPEVGRWHFNLTNRYPV